MKPPHHIRLLAILGALQALGPFAIDMYLPGFKSIAADFQTEVREVGYSLTSYFAGICLGQVFCGPIIDRFGRRLPMMIGLIIFATASIGCAVAPSLGWLVFMRLLLALGACFGMVASRAIVRDVYQPDDIARIFSTLMLIMGAAPIIAPFMGSFFIEHLSWRAVFIFLGSFTAVLLAAVYFFLPESRQPDPGISLAPAVVVQDYRIVLRHPDFLAYCVAGGLGMASMFAYISGAPHLFMNILALDEATFAWMFAINAIGFIACAQLNRVFLNHFTSQTIIRTCSMMALVVASVFITVSLAQVHSVWVYSALIFLYMSCLGPMVPNATALALRPFSRFAGSASALLGSMQMLFAAVASGLVSKLESTTAVPMATVMALCMLSLLLVVRQRARVKLMPTVHASL